MAASLGWRAHVTPGDLVPGGPWVLQNLIGDAPIRSVCRHGGGYRVRVHDVADFLVNVDATSIEVEPLEGITRELVEEVFELQVWPSLHQLRGTPAIHASSVRATVGGVEAAVAFVGAPGSGKSTLAALLAKSWPLIADDCLPVDVRADACFGVPSATRVRLRNDVAPKLGVEPNEWAKATLAVPHAPAAVPLRRVYDVAVAAPTVEIDRLAIKDAVLLLASQLHRLDPERPDLLTQELAFIERVAIQVPVCRLRYPRSVDVAGAVMEAIVRDLGALP